jgi:hypothetical protein
MSENRRCLGHRAFKANRGLRNGLATHIARLTATQDA